MMLGLLVVASEKADTQTDTHTRFMFHKYRLFYFVFPISVSGPLHLDSPCHEEGVDSKCYKL